MKTMITGSPFGQGDDPELKVGIAAMHKLFHDTDPPDGFGRAMN